MHASTTLRRAAAMSVALVAAGATVVATPQQANAGGHHGGHHKAPAKVLKAVNIAKRQKGDPYVYGASGPGSFDCSGLTSFAYGRAGIKLPRTSSAQAARARHVSRKNMRRGDLVFFHSGGSVYHVGIYWGWNNGHRLIFDAPQPGERVGFTRIWTNSWFPGRVGPKHQPRIKQLGGNGHGSSGTHLTKLSSHSKS